MRVALKSDPSKTYFAYGIYWGKSRGVFQRSHSVIVPEDRVGGFTPLVESKVDVVDDSLDHYFMRKDSYSMDMLVHRAAYPSEEFFIDLINCGVPEKVEELYARMREMGLEP